MRRTRNDAARMLARQQDVPALIMEFGCTTLAAAAGQFKDGETQAPDNHHDGDQTLVTKDCLACTR